MSRRLEGTTRMDIKRLADSVQQNRAHLVPVIDYSVRYCTPKCTFPYTLPNIKPPHALDYIN